MDILTIYDTKSEREALLKRLDARLGRENEAADDIVLKIIEDVKSRGDNALFDYTKKFDGADLSDLKVSQAEMENALNSLSPELKRAIERAIENVKEYHEKQLTREFTVARPLNSYIGRLVRPLSRVGIYVPGGRYPYPSTVVMNAVPAKAAGVKNVCMATPARADGTISPAILSAAALCEVDEIYKIGGAQAIAAFSYGTETIKRADKVVGPGNIYVARAKRFIYGVCDIDMIAGPSEILIIADSSANPRFIASDMLSQAEHDPMSSSILISTDEKTAEGVKKELAKQLNALPDASPAWESIKNNAAIVVASSIDDAVDFSNAIAPEHLEIMTADPEGLLPKIQNAGSVFLGAYSPEPLGDYMAGVNHVLPTGGSARFFSGLGADSFLKKISVTAYSKEALLELKDDICALASAEGLLAHENSVKARF